MVLDSAVQLTQSIYYREGEPEKLFVGFILWHSDLNFTANINHGAMLRSVVTPEQRGETGSD